jgi:hypothetical protein
MIVIYTFDFKQGTTTKDKVDNFRMLIISIQSVIDCHHADNKPPPTIRLYTNDLLVKEKVTNHFQGDVDIILINTKNIKCDHKFFTCAGHARIDKLFENSSIDDVLYMDNDTICKPEFIKNLKHFIKPTLYKLENWHDLSGWCKTHHNNEMLYDYIKKTYLANSDRKVNVLNNGVIYLPYGDLSKMWIKKVIEVYTDLVNSNGYSYGMDQTSMSLVSFRMNIYNFFDNKSVDNVIHYYCEKKKYNLLFDNCGIIMSDNFVMNKKHTYVYDIIVK